MKNLIYLSQCLGNYKTDRLCYYDQPPYNPNTVNQVSDYGGARWKGNPGSGWTMVGLTGKPGIDTSGYSGNPLNPTYTPTFGDVLNNAGSLNTQLQAGAQAPLATLTSAKDELTNRYNDLVSSVNQQNTTNLNAAQRYATTALGARGIMPTSELGQQEISSAIQPATAQNSANLANIGAQESQNLLPLASQIATTQNTMPTAIANALGLAAPQIQAAGFVQQAQAAGQTPLQLAQAAQARFINVGNGLIFDTQTGNYTGLNGLQNITMIGGVPYVKG